MHDFRSDTVTKPTQAMREAMASAEVGDDVYREDPTVNALETTAAEVLGKDFALYVPSGTMANQIALQMHCRPGDEVIIGEGAHVYFYEGGAGGAFAGVQFVEVGSGGRFDAEEMVGGIKPNAYYNPRTRLVALENTHNRSGGRLWDQASTRSVSSAARERGLGVHLDGARLWNAVVAQDTSAKELCAPFDTVSACFSKGLGAPVGSVIAGPSELFERALRLRRMFGGAMRQAGVIAAGALYAMEHHVARLREDHASAMALAEGLADIDGLSVDPKSVETNIVVYDVPGDAAEFCKRLSERDVLMSAIGPKTVRAVTHLNLKADSVSAALKAVRASL